MLNIVVPMAGRGSRFSVAGYSHPKPLIDVNGKHMIEVVINNLKPNCKHQFIFVCLKEHVKKYNLSNVFSQNCEKFKILEIDEVTAGAAVTVLKAEDLIDNDYPLMIANSDQWVDININQYLSDIEERNLDGSMLTMKAEDPKWSYAKVNADGLVSEVVEKIVVSDEATVGIYNFRRGSDFCRQARFMVQSNMKQNGEFYVAPVYTLMAKNGKRVGIYNVDLDGEGMFGLGIPSDLEIFLNNEVHIRATSF